MLNGTLDEYDQQILQLLQGDGRMDIAEIARRVHLTNTPVAKRVQKLRDSGFIRSYAALLNREKIGQPVLVILSLKVNPQNKNVLEEFQEEMKGLPQVQQMWVVSGAWNFILHVTAQAPQDYFVFLMEKISSLPYVGQTESAFVLQDSKDYTPYVL